MDFDLPADVHWSGDKFLTPGRMLADYRSRRFDTLRNAVKFVMEELTDLEKLTAWIATDAPHGHYSSEEIQTIYESPDFRGASAPD